MKNIDDFSKQNPFEAPEGYFDKLPSKISERISQHKSPRFEKKWAIIGAYSLVPLCLLILAGIFWIQEPEKTEILAQIPNEAIETYLVQEGIKETEIVSLYQHQELETIELEVPTEIIENEVDLEDLEDYL